MPVSISGSITVPVPRAEDSLIARIVPALAQELRNENPGAVTEVTDRVAYKRGYNFLPGTPNKFSSFDPGEFALEVAEDGLKISYRLGLVPYHLAFVMVPICAGIAIYVADSRLDFFAISGGIITICLGHIAWSLYMVKQWLKNVVMRLPAVREANVRIGADGRVTPGHGARG